VTRGPGIGVTVALALTWLLIAAAAWSLPDNRSAEPGTSTLEAVRLHIAAGRLEEAVALAESMRAEHLAAGHRAELQRLIGYAESRRGRYAEALTAYEAVLADAPALEGEAVLRTRYMAAQLCFALGRYQDAVTHLQDWQDVTPGDSGFAPYILLGQAYFKVREYPHAIRSLETGLERADGEGVQIREHWLQLLHHLYVEQRQWRDAMTVLERLTRLYPNPEYEELLARTRARG
jgi:tetratricopeptide (TPR) repeat protein